MTVKDYKKFQALSQVCDTTFGKNGLVKSGTQSVMLKVVDENTITARFLMVVNFANETEMREMTPRFKNEGVSLIEAAVKKVAEKYKDLTGKKITLKMNADTLQDGVELLSLQSYAPRRTAYFRVSMLVNVVG